MFPVINSFLDTHFKGIVPKCKLKPQMVLSGDGVEIKETQSSNRTYFESNSSYYLKNIKGNQVYIIPPTFIMLSSSSSFLIPQQLLQNFTLLNPQFLLIFPKLPKPQNLLFPAVPFACELAVDTELPT